MYITNQTYFGIEVLIITIPISLIWPTLPNTVEMCNFQLPSALMFNVNAVVIDFIFKVDGYIGVLNTSNIVTSFAAL